MPWLAGTFTIAAGGSTWATFPPRVLPTHPMQELDEMLTIRCRPSDSLLNPLCAC